MTKYFALAATLLAVGWVVAAWSEPGLPWEAMIGLLTSLSALLVILIREDQEKMLATTDQVQLQNDANLFAEFLKLLPSDGPIDFVRKHDFLGSFRYDDVKPFNTFVHSWDNAEHRFHDEELEARRVDLLRACQYFANAIAVGTVQRFGVQSVVPEHIPADGPFPEWVKRDARNINNAADAVASEHEKLVTLGRKKLPAL